MLITKQKEIPEFLQKLYEVVHDHSIDHIISWNSNGNIIIIKNEPLFESEILGNVFKATQLLSFVRQLNMYGFYKVKKFDLEKNIAYQHPLFMKD